ncbi:MAG: hypothetical protein AAF386_00255, partial [Pseudomonadota bacterium]
GPFKHKSVRWDALLGMNAPGSSDRIILLVYQTKGSNKDKYLAISSKLLGPDGMQSVRECVLRNRPDIDLLSPDDFAARRK